MALAEHVNDWRCRRMKRWAISALALVVVGSGLILALNLGGPPRVTGNLFETQGGRSTCSEWGNISTNGLRFSYPKCWESKSYPVESSFSIGLVYLSNQGMHNPCVTIRSKTSTSSTCGWPMSRLNSNGILVTWQVLGMPGLTLGLVRGRPVTIEDRAAKEEVAGGSGGGCGLVRATTAEVVFVTGTSPDNFYVMTACMRAPQVRADERLVSRMLASVRIGRRQS